jgi:alginate O-acetyltransferase complex protein AlgI
MAFTSHIFLFYFLPALLLVYYAVPGRFLAARNVLLLAAGYVFYAWASPWFAALLLGLTVVNYLLSRLIAGCHAYARVGMSPSMDQTRRSGTRLALLLTACGVALDLVALGFFKYTGFFVYPVNHLIALAGVETLPVLKILLPVGISFYTFKLISHLVDTYRDSSWRGRPALALDSDIQGRDALATEELPSITWRGQARSLLDFACYVSFFPQLLSGPIQRYGTIDRKSDPVPTFADQLTTREHTLDKFSWGVALFMLGFAKKVLLANTVAQIADTVFAAQSPSTLDAWFGALAYTFQLYFDFSAYSEMAIGIGLMLGFQCPRNFDAPYLADSFSDFWRRWHISLSSWLRDYLYIPLGGNRAGAGRTYLNLMIVFLLCGLWHGAGWTFIVWGSWHGLWLVVERALGKRSFYAVLPASVQVLATFLLVTVGWVIFRAETLAEAGRLLAVMFVPTAAQGGSTLLSAIIYTRGHLFIMALCAMLVFQPVQGFDWTRRLDWPRVLVPAGLFVLSLMTLFAQSFRSFLYFQF